LEDSEKKINESIFASVLKKKQLEIIIIEHFKREKFTATLTVGDAVPTVLWNLKIELKFKIIILFAYNQYDILIINMKIYENQKNFEYILNSIL
jgi:hypothetical protein